MIQNKKDEGASDADTASQQRLSRTPAPSAPSGTRSPCALGHQGCPSSRGLGFARKTSEKLHFSRRVFLGEVRVNGMGVFGVAPARCRTTSPRCFLVKARRGHRPAQPQVLGAHPARSFCVRQATGTLKTEEVSALLSSPEGRVPARPLLRPRQQGVCFFMALAGACSGPHLVQLRGKTLPSGLVLTTRAPRPPTPRDSRHGPAPGRRPSP